MRSINEKEDIKEVALSLIKVLKEYGAVFNKEDLRVNEEMVDKEMISLLNEVLEKYGLKIAVIWDDYANPEWLALAHKDLINLTDDDNWTPRSRAIFAEYKAYEKLLNVFLCALYENYDPNIIDEECRDKKYVEYIIEIFKEEGIITDEDIENKK